MIAMKRLEDLTGRRSGKLIVESQEVMIYNGKKQSICHCLCDCGNRCDVPASRIKSGNTGSCGCTRVIGDITGKKFGRLTAIKLAGKNKSGEFTWLCHCDCGNSKEVSAHQLVAGVVRSCGCLDRERRATFGEQSEKGREACHRPEIERKRVLTRFGEPGSTDRIKQGEMLRQSLFDSGAMADHMNVARIARQVPEGNNPYRGVCWSAKEKTWIAYCCVSGFRWQKSGFETPEEAKFARDKKQAELIDLANAGELVDARKKHNEDKKQS